MASLIEQYKIDGIVRAEIAGDYNVTAKGNKILAIEHTGNITINIIDDLTENDMDYVDGTDSDYGLSTGITEIYTQNTDNTGTVSFEHNSTPITVGNSSNFDATKLNHFLLYRLPFSGQSIGAVLKIESLTPFSVKNTLMFV